MEKSPLARDRHALYEASVQGEEYDLHFFDRVYRARNGRGFRVLREDFCGTALLACTWAAGHPERRAIGIDLDPDPLSWGRKHHLARLREAADRVRLVRGDVRTITRPGADVIAALNFSYFVFKRRRELLDYFRHARRSLRPGGVFVVNTFGGSEALGKLVERRRVAPSQGPDGLRMPGYTYVWDQVRFNPVSHEILCHIHFEFRDGTSMRRAFTYDWRLWTIPEIREVMIEAGFSGADVYTEGWSDEKNQSAGGYRKRDWFENQEGWLAYVVGTTPRVRAPKKKPPGRKTPGGSFVTSPARSRRRLLHLDRRLLDLERLAGLAARRSRGLELLQHVEPLDHLAEDGVLAVEPRRRHEGQEELAAVGARAGVRHREHAGLVVLHAPA